MRLLENVSNTPEEARRLARLRRRQRNRRCVLPTAAEVEPLSEAAIAAVESCYPRARRRCANSPERGIRALVHVACNETPDAPVLGTPSHIHDRNHRCSACDHVWADALIRDDHALESLGLRWKTISERRFFAAARSLEVRQSVNVLAYGEKPEIPEGTGTLAPAPGWLGPYRPR